MRVVSLNVGALRTVDAGGRDVVTGIFKAPVTGPRWLGALNLDGDRQADLENHGGLHKAVYAYPSEHYAFWRTELPGMDLPWGMFGENLTIEGLAEDGVNVGDRFRVGGAVIVATQPRIPCFKLGLRFGRDDIVKRFLASRRSGIYFSVAEEGLVDVGDALVRVQAGEHGVTIADVNRAYALSPRDLPLMRRLVDLAILPAGLHRDFVDRLASASD